MGYKIRDVKFDGYANGTLLDAKARYNQFIRSDGTFQPWIATDFVKQARRQGLSAILWAGW